MSQVSKNITVPLFESFCRKNQVDGLTIDATIGSHPFKLQVASTPKSQTQGYMGAQTSPAEGEGILFIYDKPLPLSFWMKDVPFPLDIIFFDSEMNYLGHETMSQYENLPDDQLKRYDSKGPARFAVETCAGWCDKHLGTNCKLSF